jgi:hypothetical protein
MEKIFMKLLMENWRKFINEETLSEGPKGFDDLPEDFKVVVSPHSSGWGNGYLVELMKGGTTFADGQILTMDPKWSPWCHENNVFMSAFTQTGEKGFGPLLYDIMMEYATLKGGGLTPHKEGGHLSPDSEHVWETYFNNRKGAIAGDNLEIIPIPTGGSGCSQTELSSLEDLDREYEDNHNDCREDCEYEEEERNPEVYTNPRVKHTEEYQDCVWDCEDQYGDDAWSQARDEAPEAKMAHMVYRKAPTVIKALGERFEEQA